MKKYLFLIFISFTGFVAAQTNQLNDTIKSELNCNTFVKAAEEMFNSADYSACINILEKGLKECSLSRLEKETALTILIKAYLETDNLEMTDIKTKELLKNNANYILKKDLVQPDFVRLYNAYKTHPLFTAGLKIGLNFPMYVTTKSYSIFDSVDYNAPYNTKTGYQFGITAEVEPLNNVAFGSNLNYTVTKFVRSINGAKGWNLKYNEKLSSFEFAGYLKAYFTENKIKPYVFAGAYISQLNNAIADVALTYKTSDRLTSQIDQYSISRKNIRQTNQRTLITNNFFCGLGARYRSNNLVIGIEACYTMGLNNIVNDKRRYSNPELIYDYYYVDNDIKMNKIVFSATVAYILKYSVKKKRNE